MRKTNQVYTPEQKEQRRKYYQKKREAWKKEGRCRWCGREVGPSLWGGEATLCRKHIDANRAKWERRPRPIVDLDRFIDVDPLKLVYAAALVDGEGYVGFTPSGRQKIHLRGKRFYPALIIRMTDPEPINFMSETFGNKVVLIKRGDYKQVYSWQTVGRLSGAVLTAILPYMKIQQKIERGKVAIKVAKTIGTFGHWDPAKIPALAQELADLQAEINKVKAPRGGFYDSRREKAISA